MFQDLKWLNLWWPKSCSEEITLTLPLYRLLFETNRSCSIQVQPKQKASSVDIVFVTIAEKWKILALKNGREYSFNRTDDYVKKSRDLNVVSKSFQTACNENDRGLEKYASEKKPYWEWKIVRIM